MYDNVVFELTNAMWDNRLEHGSFGQKKPNLGKWHQQIYRLILEYGSPDVRAAILHAQRSFYWCVKVQSPTGLKRCIRPILNEMNRIKPTPKEKYLGG